MSVSDSLSESAHPARQRSEGRIAITTAGHGPATRIAGLAEAGPSRLRLPRNAGGPLEAVMLNTGGGIASGDRYDIDVEVGEGGDLVMTTTSAEKAYRSDGSVAEVAVHLTLHDGACLAWLPQETILFDRARLRRRFDVKLPATSSLLMVEMMVFGRAAFGEDVVEGLVEDRWRVRRDGELIYADTFRLAGAVAETMKRPSVLGDDLALANVLYVAPDAEARLDEARGYLEGSRGTCGASAWNGMLITRFLAPSVELLRRDVVGLVTAFRGMAMPRVWQS
jgi:urease accessory protein